MTHQMIAHHRRHDWATLHTTVEQSLTDCLLLCYDVWRLSKMAIEVVAAAAIVLLSSYSRLHNVRKKTLLLRD